MSCRALSVPSNIHRPWPWPADKKPPLATYLRHGVKEPPGCRRQSTPHGRSPTRCPASSSARASPTSESSNTPTPCGRLGKPSGSSYPPSGRAKKPSVVSGRKRRVALTASRSTPSCTWVCWINPTRPFVLSATAISRVMTSRTWTGNIRPMTKRRAMGHGGKPLRSCQPTLISTRYTNKSLLSSA